MALRPFRTLQAIVRHGSFSRAGEVVGLTQSAVSLQVKALEDEFGVRLFDRSRRLPILTAQGRVLLERATEILSLYDQIPSALADETSLSGTLRVGAIQTALSDILPEALLALNRAHPRLRVHVTAGMSAELAIQVRNGDLDAAITTEPVRPHPADLVWTTLYQDQFVIVTPPGLATVPLPGLFAQLPYIRFDQRAWAGRLIERELRRMGIKPHSEMTLDSQDVILRMVRSGLGVAIVPVTDRMLRNMDLPCQAFGDPPLTRNVVLIESLNPKNDILIAALRRTILTSSGMGTDHVPADAEE